MIIQNKDGTEKVEIKKDGITIMDSGDGTPANLGKTISLTKNGFDNGGNKITNIADGTADNDAATVGQVNAAKKEAKKHTTIEAGDHLSIKEETDKNGGKKYTITGPSITSEDGSVTVEDNTDKGKNIGYKLSVNTEKIAEKIGKTEIESGDTNTAEVTSTKDAKTNKTTYKVNVKDMHVESGKISYDEGEGTLTLKYKDGNKVEVKGIQNTYTERGEYDEKRKKIIFKRNDGNTFNVDMSKLVNGMNFGIAKLDNKINRVGSGAAALAALKPLEFDPEDKWDVAVGYGNYMGANSLALGAFYRPNENTMFSLGGSFGDGENIINVGLSMKVGKGIQRFISKAEMANRIVEQDAEIAQLKAKDAQREAEIKALREKDEQRELQMKEILKKLNMA